MPPTKIGQVDPEPRLSIVRRMAHGITENEIAMLAGVFILLLGPPKPDRLKDRGQTK